MSSRKIVKKIAKTLPVSRGYMKRRDLEHQTIIQRKEINNLKSSVNQLQERNEEWAAEVRQLRGDAKSLSIVWPVAPEDIIKADWQKKINKNQPTKKAKPPLEISWVVPPLGPVSGGHADIFRTINYLSDKGHKNKVYFYDALKTAPFKTIKENLTNFPTLKAELFYNSPKIVDCDAIFATNWHTAYPVFNYEGSAKKYYYVQDFEPYFDPVGSYSTLANNTYRFGFRGLTLGSWLSEKLSDEFGMECDYFELGANQDEYYVTNSNPRKKILFYARPVTPRRGFELGVLALDTFHKQYPEIEINFVGWDITPYKIPFPYINNGILPPKELKKLYNECAAGLVLSFTNMSLLPLEMLASGCIPIINDSKHTQAVGYKEVVEYAAPNPTALSDALSKVITNKDAVRAIKKASDFAKKFQWDESNAKIEKILLDELT